MKKFLMMIATVAFVACTPITDSYDGETLSVIENVTVECADVLAELFGDVVDNVCDDVEDIVVDVVDDLADDVEDIVVDVVDDLADDMDEIVVDVVDYLAEDMDEIAVDVLDVVEDVEENGLLNDVVDLICEIAFE